MSTAVVHLHNMEPERASLELIRSLVKDGGCYIRWAGQMASREFCVIVYKGEEEHARYICDPLSWRPEGGELKELVLKEADDLDSAAPGCSPPDSTAFAQSRRAAVFGVTLGGACEVGACKVYRPVGGCTTAYDIETRMDDTRKGGFALLDSDILSIAARCSCGWEFYTCLDDDSTCTAMTSMFVGAILSHMPLWTIGWNSYNFDNECMRYHCDPRLRDIFMVVRTGAFDKPTYGSIINIPGCYNVDLQLYMHKSLYKLPSFKLADVAKHMGVRPKMEMPKMDDAVDAKALREYNINDCVVTLEIWRKERMEHIIPSLSTCTASPIYDCSRYVTGTLASLAYSSYCLSQGHILRWSRCTSPQVYKGGHVMEPMRGLHRDVLVCDFKSMYPTIVASCNINPHAFISRPKKAEEKDGDVVVTRHTTAVTIGSTTTTFDSRRQSIAQAFMKYQIDERDKNRRELPMYAKTLKVLSNSFYGSFGYENSALYSPLCAAAITAVGRHCIKLARRYFVKEGLTVVYGDTDSCMVTCCLPRDGIMNMVESALSKLHAYMAKTSLSMMHMSIEEHYSKAIMTGKKRYCMMLEDGSIKTTGISLSRRDVSGLCRQAASVTVDAIFKNTEDGALDAISGFILSVSYMASQGMLTLSDVSKYVKKNGVNCYSYDDPEGNTRDVPEGSADLQSSVAYHLGKCLGAVSEEIERFTIPCGLGSVSDIVRKSSMQHL